MYIYIYIYKDSLLAIFPIAHCAQTNTHTYHCPKSHTSHPCWKTTIGKGEGKSEGEGEYSHIYKYIYIYIYIVTYH